MNHLRVCFVCLQPRSMRRTEAVCVTCLKKIDRELHQGVKECAALEAAMLFSPSHKKVTL